MRVLRIVLVLAAIAVVGAGGFLVWAARVGEIEPVAPPDPSQFAEETVAKGQALAALGDCAVCHSASGGEAYAGGRPLPTPFGVIYATNITPDPDTGIGRWSQEAFMRALRQGVDRSGDYLYPAFPYDHFTKLTDADIEALYAFLMAREPVRASALENGLDFPFNIRLLMAGWNLLFLDTGAYEPNPDRDAQWNRGAYLVEGIGHCGACHTPRNLLGARKAGFRFHGADTLPGGGKSPPILAERLKEEGWTVKNLKYALKTGILPDGDTFGGPMGEVVREGTVFLSERDREAIAVYLLDLE